MKIAFFCDAYTPTRNGVAVSAASTAEELRQRGHEVVIFAPHYRGYEDKEENVVRFPAMQWFRAKDFALAWPILSSPFVLPLLYKQEKFFAAQNFDVVHTHSPFTVGTIGARWAQKYGVPSIFTFHTLYHRYVHYAPLPLWYSLPYTIKRVRRHAKLCQHVIAPSRAIARRLGYFCPGSPVSVVPTGVRVEKFAHGRGDVIRVCRGLEPDDLVLLYVGRLAPEKNLEFLLKAVAPLLGCRVSTRRVRLMLTGGGPATLELKNLVRQLSIQDDVLFTGFIDPPTMPDYFAAGDIFVFASRTETQGVSLSEALAAGLPCVVVGALGAAEAVTHKENGFVVPPDEAAFRYAVLKLIDDQKLRLRMAEAARSSAPRLALETNVDDLERIYKGVCDHRFSPLNYEKAIAR
jgi:1,2-diacylglycerol 3-alpha-glucosyltransferase